MTSSDSRPFIAPISTDPNPLPEHADHPLQDHTEHSSSDTLGVYSKRSGRIQFRKSADKFPELSYGDSIQTKNSDHIRILFQNVKGLSHSSTSDDFSYYAHSIRDLQVDVCCMAETNTPWQLNHHRQDFLHAAKSTLGQVKVEFASPSRHVDPISDTERFQAGGNLLMVSGKWIPSIYGPSIKDPSGLGRWCGLTLRGKHDNFLTIITAYRVCAGHIHSAPIGSSYAREYEFLKQSGHSKPNPRKTFVDDLAKTIRSLLNARHHVLLALDANSIVANDAQFRQLIDTCDLQDLHQHTGAPSTYIGSEHRRIDYMFGTQHVAEAAKRSGTLSYVEGPQADHRALYLDVDAPAILQYNPTDHTIPSSHQRDLKTGNPELVANYVASMQVYYINHSMEDRITKLHDNKDKLSREAIRTELEKWDNDQGRAMQQAESSLSRPRRPFAWSPQLRNACIIRRYWRLRQREALYGEDHTDTCARLQRQVQDHNAKFNLPNLGKSVSLGVIRNSLNQATKAMRKIQSESTDLRYQFYEDLLTQYLNDTNPETRPDSLKKAKIVENTIRSEQCRSMFRHIRNATNPIDISSGLQQVNVPKPRESATIPTDSHAVLRETPSHDIVWETILEPTAIEDHLIRYNRQSFRAAAASPCGHGLIHDTLTFTSLSTSGDQLLEGILPDSWSHKPDLLKSFLLSFAMPDPVPTITSIITEEQIKYGFKNWRERTSTSPSGRHLGHYRAIITDDMLRSCLTKFLNTAIKHGISLKRWQQAANVMIEKDKGKPNINRLRIIHLFEADLNLFLKLQWGRRLIRHAKKYGLLHPCQHGSVPGRTTMDPIMLTQATNDLCRILKHNIARFDNDASACYDRIIVALAMLAARRCGMPANAIRSHAETLQFMRYSVKTHYGVTKDSYTGTPFEPLFGTGQGSGASPAAWLSLVVVIMNTIDKVISDRMRFTSIDGSCTHSRLMDAYVDDTAIGITSGEDNVNMDTLIGKLERAAQTWEQLLFYSGGALNLSKCSWSIMYWEWLNGEPTLKEPGQANATVQLTQEGSSVTTTIRNQSTQEAQRLLGVYLSPTGDFTHQLEVMKTKTDTMARSLRSPRLTRQDILTFHRTMYIPALKYSLPALAVDEEELDKVQSGVMATFLQRLGFSSKLPKSIRHGPPELGGLGLFDLRTELGIAQIKFLRDAILTGKEAGKLILYSLQYSQREAGIVAPLLERPDIHIPYLTRTWITSLRQYLYNHNLTISITGVYSITTQGQKDQCIMNPDRLKGYTATQQTNINRVRLYLQVTTLSDMTDDTGLCIQPHFLRGERPSTFQVSPHWPRQPNVSKSQQRLWRRYITANYLRYGTKWIDRLGEPRKQLNNHTISGQHILPTQYPNLATYLKSLPGWYQRLLHTFRQVANDVMIWRDFRAKKKVTIVSDGGLADGIGTFGWKIVGTNNQTLFAGAGPVDGPHEMGSSTRSELGGLAAPLFLVVALARFWGLKHKCRYRWITDSKAAISKVTVVTRVSHQLRRAPDNSDYLMVIRSLRRELGKPIETIWVKGHQDGDTPYDELSVTAKHNVDVDALATWYRDNLPSAPQRTKEHIAEELFSITIQGTRYSTKVEDHIRYHVNGYYIRHYMQSKNRWNDKTWKKVNLSALAQYRSRLKPKDQHWMLKLIHDQLPLGRKRAQRSQVTDDNLQLCPCCVDSIEDRHHFLHCGKNPNLSTSWSELMTSFTKSTKTPQHPFNVAFLDCIDQWLFNSPVLPSLDSPSTPTLSYSNFPQSVQDAIATAVSDQHIIGWDNALTGILAISWTDVARQGNRPTWEAERGIRAGIHGMFKRAQSLWEGRNQALHGSKEQELSKAYSVESAAIRYYHSRPHLLATGDQHYLQRPLLQILRGAPATRRRWLLRVRQARDAYIRDGQHQRQLTSYFIRSSRRSHEPQDANTNAHSQLPHAVNPQISLLPPTEDQSQLTNNAPPMIPHSYQNSRRRSTMQSTITSFFPSARPPDQSFSNTPSGHTAHPQNPRS
jgi:hypothetical protein